MVGAGGIACGGADAPVAFAEQVLGGEAFVQAVAPFAADALVQALGEGLRQAVRQGLGHDGVVVVMVVLESLAERFGAEPGAHSKGAQVIGNLRAER